MTDKPSPESASAGNPPLDSTANASPESQPNVAELRAKVDELQDRLLRSQAEMENFRRRSANESNEARKYQSLSIIRDLVPVLDNLDRATQSADRTGDVSNLLEGIRMVARQFADILKVHGTEPITAEGEPFDPNLHEALSQAPTTEHPPMTVVQVVETGYRMHDRIVRPARVIVSCAPPPTAPQTDN